MNLISVIFACFSLLTLLFYIYSAEAMALYLNPSYLFVVLLILSFWIFRVIIYANNSKVSYDPVNFALTDKVSWLCLVIALFSIITAI